MTFQIFYITTTLITSLYLSASAWKAGTCPGLPVPIDPDAQYTDRCWNDEDCSGDRKCCMSVVGKACMLPVESSGEMRPGVCPAFYNDYGGIKTDHCQRDSDCSSPRKCCDTVKGRRCLVPDKTNPNQQKPGTCPTFYGIPDEDSFDRCKSDFQCPGSRKCCTTRNFIKLAEILKTIFSLIFLDCFIEQVKPGFCPPVYGIISPRAFNRCNNDADCTSNKKCCDTVSGRACMSPSGNFEEETNPIIIIKPGRCPRFYGSQQAQLFDRCIRDSDCNGNRKCCATRTGKECLIPNYGMYSESDNNDISDNNNNINNNNIRPGICPPYFGVVNVIKNMCAVDSDCKMPRKCCQTITGKMCLLLS
ncbi:Whey acidic protein [Trichinella pseudospiralis]|uniref:Whey acidic protein n=1 Tax=Trichinella pseudospiralis TaxID=6337 RepID=A0A0V1FV85_TRIPS|nr:Whey acidic protein [Trichinella pseudospiralis]